MKIHGFRNVDQCLDGPCLGGGFFRADQAFVDTNSLQRPVHPAAIAMRLTP